MGRKKTPTSTMNVAEKQNTDLAKRLDGLITDVNALKNYLGISAQAINQYRLGISRPSLENLCKIADYYHVTTDYLLGRTTSKSIDEDVLTTIQTVGLSDLAVYALKSDSNGKKNRDIFFIEDFLIRELYVSSWARYIRDCVRNIAQLETLRPKLGADLVEDKTEYYRWQATQRFEKSLDDAIKEFSPLYADDLKIDDKRAYLAERRAEFEKYLERIIKMERDEQNRQKEQPANTANGNQKSLGPLKGAKTIAR